MATNAWKYEEGEYNLQELCKKHPPPVIVQCKDEIGEVTVDNTTFDLSKPILLYRQRNINKVTAKIIHREIYREVGPPLLIPEDYKGWFAVLQKRQIKPGTLRQDILEFKLVAELSNSNTQTFLIGGTEKVHALQVTTFSDGKYQHQQRSLFPGEVLRRGKIYIGERKRKSAIFRRQKMKQDYYLLCTDECDREVLLPFTQKGLFYTITTENGRMACPVLQMKDLLDKKYLPATVKLLFGKLPNLSCDFTDTLRLEDSHFERSVIACTVSDTNNFIELPLSCALKFQIFDMDETIVSSALYKRAFTTCNEKVHVYMRGIKVCHEFGELKVMSEDEKFNNEMPPNPHILRQRKPLDLDMDDNRESGYIEMRPESFEFTKECLYTDMSQGGVPDSEIDLDDMDYVLPSVENSNLHDPLQRSCSSVNKSKTLVIDRHQSFSLPPPTTPPPPLPHACSGTLPKSFHTYIDLDSGLSDSHLPISLVRSRSRIEKAQMDQIYDIPRIPKRQSAPDVLDSNLLSINSMPTFSECSPGEAIKYENFSILREVVPKPCGKNRIPQRQTAQSFQYDSPQYDCPQNLDVVRTINNSVYYSSSDSEGCSADSQYYFEELNERIVEENGKSKKETELEFSENNFEENGKMVHTLTGEQQHENLCQTKLENNSQENNARDSPPIEVNKGEGLSLQVMDSDTSSNTNTIHGQLFSHTVTLLGDINDVSDGAEMDQSEILSHINDCQNGEKVPLICNPDSGHITSFDKQMNDNIEKSEDSANKNDVCENQTYCDDFVSTVNIVETSEWNEIFTDTSVNTSDINSHCEDNMAIDIQNDENKKLDWNIVTSPQSEYVDITSDLKDDISCDVSHNIQQDIHIVEGSLASESGMNVCLQDSSLNPNGNFSNVKSINSESDITDENAIQTSETCSFDRLNSVEELSLDVAPPPCPGFNKISKNLSKETTDLKTNLETVDNQASSSTNENPVEVPEKLFENTDINNEILSNKMTEVNLVEHHPGQNLEAQHLEAVRSDSAEPLHNVHDTVHFHSKTDIECDNEQSNTFFENKSIFDHSVAKQIGAIVAPTDETDDVDEELEEPRIDDDIQTKVTDIKYNNGDGQECSNADHNNSCPSTLDENHVTEDFNRSENGIDETFNEETKGVSVDNGRSSSEMNKSSTFESNETGEDDELSIMSNGDIVNEFRKLGVRRDVIKFVIEKNLEGANFKNVQKLGEILPGVSVIDKRKISIFLRTALSRKITNTPKKIDPLEPLWV